MRASSACRLCTAVVFTASVLTQLPLTRAQDRDLPKGFQQIIPRGRIAAIDQPVYVSAEDADIRADAWVLGVSIGDEARAYSLDLLNAHEVVNDSIGDTNFAAVW